MPKKPVIQLPPIDLGEETIGKRIARLRKEKGFTQKELAEKIGTSHSIVSDYEIGRIRLYDEMVARFSIALEVSSDELLGLKQTTKNKEDISLKYSKRIKKIEKLPDYKIRNILRTLDDMIKANEG